MQNPVFKLSDNPNQRIEFLPVLPSQQMFVEFEKDMREKVCRYFAIDLARSDEIECQSAGRISEYKVPAIVQGKPATIRLTGSIFKKISKMVEDHISERKRLARLSPKNPLSKRYQQRKARKAQRKK